MIFRIDDVSVNTDVEKLYKLVRSISTNCPDAKIVLAVSPLVHDMRTESKADHERVFPRILSAMSDHREFFKVDHLGLPKINSNIGVVYASHGLIHVDHRLLSRDVQEFSIVTSCSLVHSNVFVPPFNKWNKDTESVCQEHGINLVKFEDGWKHVRFNRFVKDYDIENKYYLHTHDVSVEYLQEWFVS